MCEGDAGRFHLLSEKSVPQQAFGVQQNIAELKVKLNNVKLQMTEMAFKVPGLQILLGKLPITRLQ